MRSEGRGRPIQIQMLIDPVMDPSRGPLCLSATMQPSSSPFFLNAFVSNSINLYSVNVLNCFGK